MLQRLRQLSAAIILLLPLYYFRFSILSVPTNGIEILIIILFLSTAYLCARSKDMSISFPWAWPVVLILLGITLSSAISSDKHLAFGILKGWFIIPMLYYIAVATLFKSGGHSLLIRALYANLILVGLYALLQWLGVIHLVSYQSSTSSIVAYVTQHRAIAFFESPNYLAMYLVPPALLAFGYYFSKNKPGRYWLLLIPLSAIVLTYSRGAMVALLTGLVLIVSAKKSFRLAVISSAVVLLISIILLLALPHVGGSGGDQARTYIWNQAAQLIRDHPILGIGPGQFNGELNARLPANTYYQQSVREYALHAHNILLNFWLSGGVLALGGFVWLMVATIRRLLIAPGELIIRYGLLAALMAILIHGTVDTTYFKNDLALHFWLIIGLSATMKPNGEHITDEEDRY